MGVYFEVLFFFKCVFHCIFLVYQLQLQLKNGLFKLFDCLLVPVGHLGHLIMQFFLTKHLAGFSFLQNFICFIIERGNNVSADFERLLSALTFMCNLISL